MEKEAEMKTLRMLRNIAALCIVAIALASSSWGNQRQPPPSGDSQKQSPPKWCDQTINPCCCRSGKTGLPKTDPRHDDCVLTCAFP
jgi:hypothetical protein